MICCATTFFGELYYLIASHAFISVFLNTQYVIFHLPFQFLSFIHNKNKFWISKRDIVPFSRINFVGILVRASLSKIRNIFFPFRLLFHSFFLVRLVAFRNLFINREEMLLVLPPGGANLVISLRVVIMLYVGIWLHLLAVSG